jgi:transcriptional regulator with XRE-family HTH domain
VPGDSRNRHELGRFLRSRRERVKPADVGFPVGPRRRTLGLRREEVAVLAGLSPTWYTYLEQGRDIHPSPEVLNSIARVLRCSEDERRYMHTLAYGRVIDPKPLGSDVAPEALVQRIVEVMGNGPYPVYAVNLYTDLIAWNKAATQWYDDWGRFPVEERNMLRWMLTAPRARERLADWESDTRDVVARWRAMTPSWLTDDKLRKKVAELSRLSPEFSLWWNDHDVLEHRSRVRRFRHPKLGLMSLRLVVMEAAEITPSFIVVHLPGVADSPSVK